MASSLRREARLVALAVQMLTRVPVPSGPLHADGLARAAKVFPLVGAAVGAVAGAALVGASLLWPAPIPALVAVAAALAITGALHEDGLADTADGLGGGSRERMLAIMKDPRLGSFGALALGVTLALKVAALSCLPAGHAAAALIAAGALSRFWAVAVMAQAGYAGDRALARLDHGVEGPRPGEVALALAFAFGPLLLLDLGIGLAGLALSAGAATLLAVRVCRRLGGYTGDVLGAVIAVGETAFLLGAAASWRPGPIAWP